MVSQDQVVHLDVRPYFKKKLEPFQIIMDAVNALGNEEILLLHAIFKPTPLLGLLKMKGYAYKLEAIQTDYWIVAFAHKSEGKERLAELRLGDYIRAEADLDIEPVSEDTSVTPIDKNAAAAWLQDKDQGRVVELDNRGLEPPQPMVRTLNALKECASGDRIVIHNDRVPMFLLEELRVLGFPYSIQDQPDGSAVVTIRKT